MGERASEGLRKRLQLHCYKDGARAVLEAGLAALEWYEDTGDCHFCTVSPKGRHEGWCPLRPFTNGLTTLGGERSSASPPQKGGERG